MSADKAMAGKLAAYAARHGISEGEALRQALDKLLSPEKVAAEQENYRRAMDNDMMQEAYDD